MSQTAIEATESPGIPGTPGPPGTNGIVNGARWRLATLLGAHTLVDVYSAFMPPLLGVMEIRCHLSESQTAWLLGIGSLTSGLSQPLAAWLSDRTDSRVFGAIGLVLAAVCLSLIGYAESFETLVPLYALGMVGVGIFHPIGASSMGQLSGKRRSFGITMFFVAGMIGGITGSKLSPWITGLDAPILGMDIDGFALLQIVMIPGLLIAVILHFAIRHVPHRHHGHHLMNFSPHEVRRRWMMVGVLYVSNALRFTVNMALIYLFVRWAQAHVGRANPGWSEAAIADAAAPINGSLNAFVVVGMLVGGLVAGTLIPAGREKWPLVITAIVMAPLLALFPFANLAGGYLLAVLAGIGFAAMVPVSLAVAQRLLPHRTSLASGLMLGGAWAFAVLGPRLAEYVLNEYGLNAAFTATAIVLAISGLLCLPLQSKLLHETTRQH